MKYSDILKNKVEIMAIAMLLIMFCHSPIIIDNDILSFIHSYSYIGVDIFLLLSGAGCLYSYRKGKSKKLFIKKRIMRTLPFYLPITIVLCFLLLKLRYIGVGEFWGQVTLTNFFLGLGKYPRWYWYVPSLLVLYLLTPLIVDFHDKYKDKIKVDYVIAGITFLILLLGIIPKNCYYYLFIGRIPIYLIGLYIGDKAYHDQYMKKSHIFFCLFSILVAIFPLLTLLSVPISLKWYGQFIIYFIFIFVTLGLVIGFSIFFNFIRLHFPKFKFAILHFIGGFTLEIYTIHERLIIIGVLVLNKFHVNITKYDLTYNIIIILITIFLAYICNKLIKWLMTPSENEEKEGSIKFERKSSKRKKLKNVNINIF